MIISNSQKYIFVHIPKCAGISITDSLTGSIQWNDIILHGGKSEYGSELEPYFDRRYGLHGHATASAIRAVVGNKIWEEYLSFSFVRNPYARVASLYNWVSKIVNNVEQRHWKEKDWYRWPLFHAFLETENFSGFIRSHFFDKGHIARDQYSWVCDDRGENIIVNFIGRTESLDSDFASALAAAGLPAIQLDKLNVSTKRDFRDMYTRQEDIDLVYQKYYRDFKEFGYSSDINCA